jgi:hypothetical protein
VKNLLLLLIFAIILVIVINKLRPGIIKLTSPEPLFHSTDIGYVLPAGSFFNGDRRNANNRKIDWHNYKLIEAERIRKGVGEKGVAASLNDEEQKGYDALFNTNGYNALLSDKISVNRSVPDIRHAG